MGETGVTAPSGGLLQWLDPETAHWKKTGEKLAQARYVTRKTKNSDIKKKKTKKRRLEFKGGGQSTKDGVVCGVGTYSGVGRKEEGPRKNCGKPP